MNPTPRKAVLSNETRAILAHLRTAGACTLPELLAALPATPSAHTLRTRLRTLTSGTWLECSYPDCSASAELQWSIHPFARSAVALALDPPPNHCALVPPRTINLMAGLYTHQPLCPTRLGALDHAAVASRGQHC